MPSNRAASAVIRQLSHTPLEPNVQRADLTVRLASPPKRPPGNR